MRIALVAAAVAVLATPVSGAEFEGLLESKISVQGAGAASGGTSKIWVSHLGTRMEMEIGASGQGMKITTIVLRAKPGLAFMVNDARKTYSEIDFAKVPEPAKKDQETYTVRKLGSERVAGFDCTHVLVKGSGGSEFEIWSTKDLGNGSDYWASQRSASRSRSALAKALQEAAADGWPVKSVHRTGKIETTSELLRADRKAVPASLLDLSGYKKSEETGALGMAGQMQLSPEQQKQMDAARSQMTPEQRKRMEEMMKGQGGAAPRGD